MDLYIQDTDRRQAAEDRGEREHDRLVSDLLWMLKRRHVADYRSDIADVVSELREFN